ncbi:MAG TPA: SusC/RagA family TonB-linked outer membrane protein, partial [Chitinophagaceae bacterium]|nr:SusC/RagA family TonB-linked outer membrane protein [Chitinophagaceae bacterium]
RYGFFPSVGAGWVVSQEQFFEPLQDLFQLFKFRFSYGLVGNSRISGRRFAYIATVANASGYTFGENMDNYYPGKDIGDYASDVSWEVAHKTNFGLNIDALNGKISLQANYFKQHRTGIFLQRNSLPYYLGLRSSPYGNVGVIDNHGIDGTLTWNGNLGDFHFQLIGNFTWTRNKVIQNDQPEPKYPWLDKKGLKVGQTFGYVALGLFESKKEIENSPKQNGDVRSGDIKYKDINGDGKIDSYDRMAIGYGDIPEVVYGLGFSFSYKSFSLTGLFQGVGNVDILLSGEGFQPFQQGLSRGNLLSNITDRWTVKNPDPHAFYPRLSPGTVNDNYEASTWWLKNGRYLRLKSLQFSYDLPQTFLDRLNLKNAYVFLTGVNLLTFTPFDVFDVELGNGKGAAYPNTKNYSAGFGLKF